MFGRAMPSKRLCGDQRDAVIGTDRISSLPDVVLHHILSFLDTKYAVQTCVLARRWVDIWTNVPNLNFNIYSISRSTSCRTDFFKNLVLQVMSRRSLTDIRKFVLSSELPLQLLTAVIYQALRLNVQQVEIDAQCCPYFQVFKRLLTSKSLEVLKLSSHSGIAASPRSLDFIYLKELHLGYTLFDIDGVDEREVFSNCHNLNILILSSCCCNSLKSLKIAAPQLTRLEILCSLEEASSLGKCKIIVSTPKLSFFKYEGCSPLVCSTENLSSLENVDINVSLKQDSYESIRSKENIARRLISMLMEFHQAKSLTISLKMVEALSEFPNLLGQQSSPFGNLKNLNLEMVSPVDWIELFLQKLQLCQSCCARILIMV